MNWLWVILAILVGFGLWVRLAPSDAAKWHQPVKGEADKTFDGGALRIINGDAQSLARLDEVIRATPRTRTLAGSIGEGRVTYITRTALWGFPDYTTIELRDGAIAVLGRLRFGRSDFGVNKARVDGWLDALTR
ncbi:MAG: DUF1499 domain-containing protein [Thalassovita sp.]